jgi:hypothetical protein
MFPPNPMSPPNRSSDRSPDRSLDPTLTCPHCQQVIHLTESLAGPLIEASKQEFRAQLALKDQYVQQREQALQTREAELVEQSRSMDFQVQQQAQQAREKIAVEEATRARHAVADELAQAGQQLALLQASLQGQAEQVAQAKLSELEFLKARQALMAQQQSLELSVEQAVTQRMQQWRSTSKAEFEAPLLLKLMERDALLASTQSKLTELTQRVEQSGPQLHGEVSELALENLLRARFVLDKIEPVAKGESGADIKQSVYSNTGQACGTILWESKRTKNFAGQWLDKLKEDQRASHADVAVLVSSALPKGVQDFEQLEGIWVIQPSLVVPVAMLLRDAMQQLSLARLANVGLQSKTALIYEYLTGPRFRARVEAMVDAFRAMQEDLMKERTAIKRLWAKREQQIERMASATVGMWGELQGIAGKSLQEIEGLELQSLRALGADGEDAV